MAVTDRTCRPSTEARSLVGFLEQVLNNGPNQCGLHVNGTDPADMVSGISEELSDNDQLHRWGRNGRERSATTSGHSARRERWRCKGASADLTLRATGPYGRSLPLHDSRQRCYGQSYDRK